MGAYDMTNRPKAPAIGGDAYDVAAWLAAWEKYVQRVFGPVSPPAIVLAMMAAGFEDSNQDTQP